MTQFVPRDDIPLRVPTKGTVPRPDRDVYGITVHYTTGEELGRKNTRDWWRAIQDYHLSRDYSDIAYNFGFDIYGNVLEGRDVGVRGAHAATTKPIANANEHFWGVAFLGDDDLGEDVTPAAARALSLLLGLFFLRYEKIPLLTVHSDFKATACPGNELRNIVRYFKGTKQAW